MNNIKKIAELTGLVLSGVSIVCGSVVKLADTIEEIRVKSKGGSY